MARADGNDPLIPRRILLWDYAGRAPNGRIATPLPLRWPDKPAAALLDYSLDATELLASPTDTLMLTVNAADGVTVTAAVVAAGVATVWLRDGTSGDDAAVDLTLTTTSTRRVHRIVRLGIT